MCIPNRAAGKARGRPRGDGVLKTTTACCARAGATEVMIRFGNEQGARLLGGVIMLLLDVLDGPDGGAACRVKRRAPSRKERGAE